MTKNAPYKGLGADSEEKHEPVSDIDTAVVDSLKVLDPDRPIREADIAVRQNEAPRAELLALQLHFLFEVCAPRFGLVGAPPERPCDDVGGLDAPLCELDGDAADFLDRPADQECLVRRRGSVFLGAVTFAWWRMTAIMAKASMTSETWRCQPCQERVSL